MQYSKIQIDSDTKKYSVKNLKIRSADPTRPTKIRQNRDPTRPDPTRPDPTRGSIRPVDNSDRSSWSDQLILRALWEFSKASLLHGAWCMVRHGWRLRCTVASLKDGVDHLNRCFPGGRDLVRGTLALPHPAIRESWIDYNWSHDSRIGDWKCSSNSRFVPVWLVDTIPQDTRCIQVQLRQILGKTIRA